MKKKPDPDVIISHKEKEALDVLLKIINETREFDVEIISKGRKYSIVCESKFIDEYELAETKEYCETWINGWDCAMEKRDDEDHDRLLGEGEAEALYGY